MKRNIIKQTISFVFALVLILSSFSVPVSLGILPENTITASAASTKLAKVTGLKATADVKTATLSWKKVSGAAGYNICRYDTAKKKYVSVKNVTDTKASVKGLKAATTYRFAVRAYKKSGKTLSYGPLSSQVTVVTRPNQVTGIKAARTENSIQLEWNAQKGVTGYIVYRYDSAKKKYITAAKTKDDTATVSGLKAGTTYYFVIRAYVTVSKKNYYSELSDKVKAQTLKAGYRIAKYQKIDSGEKFTIEGTLLDEELGNTPITYAYRSGDYVLKSKFEGIEARILYFGKTGNSYLVMDQFSRYMKLNGTSLENIADDMEMEGGFAVPVYGNIKTGTKTISGKKYNYETYRDIDSNKIVFYFSGSTLVRIDQYDGDEPAGSIIIKKYTASVNDSLFTVPKSYSKVNLSWLAV